MRLSDIDIPGGGLGLKRSEMPQIEDGLKFLDELEASGVRVQRLKWVNVDDLTQTQGEFNLRKIRSMMAAPLEDLMATPVIVSNDYHVLDGHHRWAAILNGNPNYKIPVYFVDLPIEKLLARAHNHDGVSYKKVSEALVEEVDRLLESLGQYNTSRSPPGAYGHTAEVPDTNLSPNQRQLKRLKPGHQIRVGGEMLTVKSQKGNVVLGKDGRRVFYNADKDEALLYLNGKLLSRSNTIDV